VTTVMNNYSVTQRQRHLAPLRLQLQGCDVEAARTTASKIETQGCKKKCAFKIRWRGCKAVCAKK
jgi:hypothetical protein